MQKKYTKEEIKKALEQAIANLEMEEVIIHNKETKENIKSKTMVKGDKYGFRA